MPVTRRTEVESVVNGQRSAVIEELAVEARLRLVWSDGDIIEETTGTPANLTELAAGVLLLTRRMTVDSGAVSVEESEDLATVTVQRDGVRAYEGRAAMSGSPCPTDLRWAKVTDLLHQLRVSQEILNRTGCAHGCLVMSLNTGEIIVREDIRRTNALRKAIGAAVLAGMNLHRTVLLFTGRLTSEIVSQCATAGVAAVFSLAVATDTGIRIARESRLTLVGSVGTERVWVYNEANVRLV